MGQEWEGQFTRKNHYVPESYYRPWTGADGKVATYRTLVPREEYPRWERLHPSKIAFRRDLYTLAVGGVETDAIERWLNDAVENPAQRVLARLRSGEALGTDEWRIAAAYIVAQDIRTPAGYAEYTDMGLRHLARAMEGSLRTFRRQTRGNRSLRSYSPPAVAPAVQGRTLPVRFTFEKNGNGEGGRLAIEGTIAREWWLSFLQRRVAKDAEVIARHSWQILRPVRGGAWFTSDHPVMRLGYRSPTHFTFGSGWAQKGAEIVLPLSPDALLYTKVGRRESVVCPGRLSAEATGEMQRCLALRAHRWIVASDVTRRAEWFRPRRVSLAEFVEENGVWDTWHDVQSAVERDPHTTRMIDHEDNKSD